MPLPDICLGVGDNEGSGGLGQTPGVGGGVGNGTITDDDGVSNSGSIGNLPCNRPVISNTTAMKRAYNIQIKQPNDLPLDLSTIDKVMFYAKETYDAANFYIQKECIITDAAEGMISLKLTKTDTPYSGVWWAGFHLVDQDGTPISQYEAYLYVEKSLTSNNRTNNTITIPEVRMALLDRCAADNLLLDDIEFSDSEIAFAIRRPVDEWNERPPRIMNKQYTTATFPYRYYWIEATCGELLKATSRNLIRNKLNYNAGGVSVDDKSRAPIYMQLGEQIHQQYLQWMNHEKARLNAENIYGSISSVTYY